jgi:hypothetical protein
MKHRFSGGYIAILAVLITVVIIAFLMIQQYERIGTTEKAALDREAFIQGETGDTSLNSGATYVKPIDRAIDIKNTLEARDRGMVE